MTAEPMSAASGKRFTLNVHIMKTNIVIDDKLTDDALKLTGLRTKREVAELSLKPC